MIARRPSFLPIFFVLLAVAFVAVVLLRVRSLAERDAAAPPIATATTATAAVETRPATADPGGVSDPGVLLPADANGQAIPSSSTVTPAGVPSAQPRAMSRADRFRELLGMPLSTPAPSVSGSAAPSSGGTIAARPATAAAPAAAPQQKSGLIARAINAITGRDSTPAPAPATSQPQSPGSSSGSEPPAAEPADRSSDTQAPRLVAVSFMPAQVQDGETTTMTITATDDLSGVRNISGSISSPSGALQGFACTRVADTENWTTRIVVPKDAAEGVWRVNYLSMSDLASNSVHLGGNQGMLPPTASFRVVSTQSDSTGPTLRSVSLARPAMQAGEKNTIYVHAEDDKSGVLLVSGVFQSPSNAARIGFGCRNANGQWECEFSPPTCIDCGEWKLEQLQMQDKANNQTTVRVDNPMVAAVRVDIRGQQCDAGAPTLASLVLDQTVVSNETSTVITITANVQDDTCGMASMSGQAVGPPGGADRRLYVSFSPTTDPFIWSGKLRIEPLTAKGTWTISGVQMLDKAHNLKVYSQGEGPLANATFRVQ